MLVVGILIGVGISGRGFVEQAERDQLEGEIAALQEDLDAANASAEDFELRQEAAAEFVESAYPVLAESRLAGRRFGLVVLGPVGQGPIAFVDQAVRDRSGRIERMRALELPLRVDAIEAELESAPALAGYVGEDQLGNLGRDLGRELVAGGETPLWDALEDEIVEQRAGGLTEPTEGVVVIRSAEPQQGPTSRF